MGRSQRLLVVFSLFAFLCSAVPVALASESTEVTAAAAVAPASVEAPIRLEDDDLRLSFTGAWTSVWNPALSGHTSRGSRSAGAQVYASFEGTSVALISSCGPDRGKANLYIDDVHAGEIDFYAPAYTASGSVWSTDTLTPGAHTVRLVLTGTKSPASRSAYVLFDAFQVAETVGATMMPGTVLDSGSPKLARVGTWTNSARAAAYGGSAWRTRSKGSAVLVRFKGTGITWFGRKDSNSGKAEVLIDGKRAAVVSQYSPTVLEQRVGFSISGLPYGVHTLTVRCLDAASAAGGGDRTDVDGFAVRGTILQAYRPSPFNYSWPTYIVVDKSSFRLYWVKNGMLVKTYPIAHGKPSSPTPSRIWRIDAKYYSDPAGVYGPRKMRLFRRVSTSRGYRYEYTRYLIHGTNQPWVIGTRASAGCIRMYNRDALELWPQVPLGTVVVTRD